MELEDVDDEQPCQQPVHLEEFRQVDGIYFWVPILDLISN